MAARGALTLCPSLVRAAGAVEIGPVRTSVRDRPGRIRRASFATTATRREEGRVQRYGTANEPPPHLMEDQGREGRGGTSDRPAPPPKQEKEDVDQKKLPSPAEDLQAAKSAESKKDPVQEMMENAKSSQEEETPKDPASGITEAPVEPPPKAPKPPAAKAMETVLNMPPPSEEGEENRPPHLAPPPYVHHFDTYSLVKRLDDSGFSGDQSTTIMKAVRTLLAENMDLARRGLVSKSNVENETYLFRAACSELKTEVENNRKGELEKNRTRRGLLQHEVDILGQKMTQESGNLRDELKGMFDDRKMTVRMEHRSMENKIQELNYKITVALNSDAKTEVEGVRWVLTRRAATALGVSVLMILATLNYARYMTASQDKERKEHEKAMQRAAEANAPVETKEMSTQTDTLVEHDGERLVAREGVNLA